MSALDAAVTLGKASGWSLTNLEMQKLLYLAQMDYMGEHGGTPLFGDEFQAWNLGPVVPSVYAQAKTYGRNPVRSLFHHGELADGDQKATILGIYDRLKTASAWDLVSITHWKGGAWYKNFTPGKMFTPIPKADILDEYRNRIAFTAAAILV